MLIIAGIVSYTTLLPREGFPPIQVPFSIANGSYLVSDSERVDQEVTKPLSEVMSSVEGVEVVNTTADDNFFVVAIQFEESVDSTDGTERVKRTVEESGVLPNEANIEFTVIQPAKYLNEFDTVVSVYNQSGLSLEELHARAQTVADELVKTESIISASVQTQFSEGINPETGMQAKQQTSFDRIGLKGDEGKIKFYQSVSIGVKGSDNLDVLELSDEIETTVAKANSESNGTYGVAVSADFAPAIENQIGSLQSNVLTGLIAVSVISFLLIAWRASIITGLFMGTVMLLVLFILFLVDYTLNTISLFALVLALGLFVDDATIVVEAIDAGRKNKKKARTVAKEAIGKVAGASFAGTMTTVLVFVPLVFVSGILGEFIRILPVTIIIALLTSLVISLTLIPLLSKFILLRSQKQKRRNPISRLEGSIANALSKPPLVFAKSRKKGLLVSAVFILISLVFVGGSGFYANKLKFNIFPSTGDADALSIDLAFEQGTDIDEATATSQAVEDVVAGTIGEHVTQSTYGAYNQATQRSANIYLELVPFTDRDTTSKQMIAELNTRLSGFEEARIRVSQIDAGPPVVDFPFQVQIFSEDQSKSLALAQSVSGFLNGRQVERANGTTALIDATKIDNNLQVVRKDSRRFIQVGASFDADDTTALVEAAKSLVEAEYGDEKLAEFGLTASDIAYDFGQESENQESFSSLIFVGPIAALAMFILLAIQFRSLLQPLLIFLAIPFSLFGVMFGLYITDNPISFFSMVGFFGLVGIAVNNTILLTDYANQERRSGKGIAESISEATKKRFRPLLTTSLTTVAALTPLALSDPFWEPLAVTIIFGLLSSTFLVVVSFPYFYLLAEWARSQVSVVKTMSWLVLLVVVPVTLLASGNGQYLILWLTMLLLYKPVDRFLQRQMLK